MGFGRQTAVMFGAVAVWALHFAVSYGGAAVACARGMPQVAVVAVVAATAVAVPLLLWIMVHGYRRRARFEYGLGATLAAFALVGVVWQSLPVLIVEACA